VNEGKPVTTFLVVSLILYALFLWRQGRLGHIGGGALVPPPATFIGPPVPSPAARMGWPQEPYGYWRQGTPPIIERNP
jgi:hypothetical protein